MHYAVLRSLTRAAYGPQEDGHFALASDCYCHFTSPIRRYPDLTIHRALEALLAAGKRPTADGLLQLGEECSELERRAEAAERELVKLKLLLFLVVADREEMDAVITGVEAFGIFVQGLGAASRGARAARCRCLPTPTATTGPATRSSGRRAGQSYRLGDRGAGGGVTRRSRPSRAQLPAGGRPRPQGPSGPPRQLAAGQARGQPRQARRAPQRHAKGGRRIRRGPHAVASSQLAGAANGPAEDVRRLRRSIGQTRQDRELYSGNPRADGGYTATASESHAHPRMPDDRTPARKPRSPPGTPPTAAGWWTSPAGRCRCNTPRSSRSTWPRGGRRGCSTSRTWGGSRSRARPRSAGSTRCSPGGWPTSPRGRSATRS